MGAGGWFWLWVFLGLVIIFVHKQLNFGNYHLNGAADDVTRLFVSRNYIEKNKRIILAGISATTLGIIFVLLSYILAVPFNPNELVEASLVDLCSSRQNYDIETCHLVWRSAISQAIYEMFQSFELDNSIINFLTTTDQKAGSIRAITPVVILGLFSLLYLRKETAAIFVAFDKLIITISCVRVNIRYRLVILSKTILHNHGGDFDSALSYLNSKYERGLPLEIPELSNQDHCTNLSYYILLIVKEDLVAKSLSNALKDHFGDLMEPDKRSGKQSYKQYDIRSDAFAMLSAITFYVIAAVALFYTAFMPYDYFTSKEIVWPSSSSKLNQFLNMLGLVIGIVLPVIVGSRFIYKIRFLNNEIHNRRLGWTFILTIIVGLVANSFIVLQRLFGSLISNSEIVLRPEEIMQLGLYAIIPALLLMIFTHRSKYGEKPLTCDFAFVVYGAILVFCVQLLYEFSVANQIVGYLYYFIHQGIMAFFLGCLGLISVRIYQSAQLKDYILRHQGAIA